MVRRAGAGARSWRFGVALACGLLVAAVALCLGASAASAAASGLPDGRGWELVSAADKNGGDVIGDPDRVRVADDGSAVGYASLTEFGDSLGGGIATDYLSVRSPQVGGQGWVTHGIIPPQPALSYQAATHGFEPRYEDDFSPDLSRGVLFAWRPVTSEPLVANVANLYLRDDLRSPGVGHYALVSECPLCIGPLPSSQLVQDPIMVAGTPDLSHVLFESAINLAPRAVGGGIKLYDWDAASQQVVLAGVLPDGSGALDSEAGVGHGRFEHRHAISADGRKVFFMASPAGVENVYMRLDERTTVQLNRSELTAGPETAQSAFYGDASVDGSRVFFISPERLTDDAPPGGGLYMYDTTRPDTDPHNLTYLAPGSRVVDASADGHTVYFTGNPGLVPGHPTIYSTTLYAWHEGQLAFVANLPGEDVLKLAEGDLGKTPRVAASGALTFLSSEPTPANPAGSCPQTGTGACDMLYLYTPGTAAPVCVSCHPDASPPSTSVPVLFIISGGGEALNGHMNRMLSDDGRRVFFTTAEPLVPEDVNGKRDAYEYDTTTGTVHLISSGRSTADSYFLETNPSGNDALFYTREQLVGWDTDTNYDLYDARIGGGMPEPTPPPPACTGPDCHPTPTTPPSLAPTSSQTAHTTGNLPSHLKPRHKPCTKHHTHTHHKTRCTTQKTRSRAARRRARRHLR